MKPFHTLLSTAEHPIFIMFSTKALVINTVKITGSSMALQNGENKNFNEDKQYYSRRNSNFSLSSITKNIRKLSGANGSEATSNSKEDLGKRKGSNISTSSPSPKLANYLNEFLESLTCIRIVNNPHIPIPQKNYRRGDNESC
ncbi:unnamed protein product [Orchesella dallaii]|uniref:Uncharacterized protein n=1 Tax=Orchesella dallaii TaxID=48710 RepID=A0ABP1RF11_9HEXA